MQVEHTKPKRALLGGIGGGGGNSEETRTHCLDTVEETQKNGKTILCVMAQKKASGFAADVTKMCTDELSPNAELVVDVGGSGDGSTGGQICMVSLHMIAAM